MYYFTCSKIALESKQLHALNYYCNGIQRLVCRVTPHFCQFIPSVFLVESSVQLLKCQAVKASCPLDLLAAESLARRLQTLLSPNSDHLLTNKQMVKKIISVQCSQQSVSVLLRVLSVDFTISSSGEIHCKCHYVYSWRKTYLTCYYNRQSDICHHSEKKFGSVISECHLGIFVDCLQINDGQLPWTLNIAAYMHVDLHLLCSSWLQLHLKDKNPKLPLLFPFGWLHVHVVIL